MCQSLGRFAKDGGITYDAFDADQEYGCLCDSGFRGPDCGRMECPSGPDPMGGPGGNGLDGAGNVATARECSGRGRCDETSGVCRCAKGFFGEACGEQTTLV